LAFLIQLNEEVDSNTNKRQIIIIEEYGIPQNLGTLF
jgi:hypothetical protein